MSVLVEAITVIFRNATADQLIQGGVSSIRNNPPNGTFRTDGKVSAVGFMTPEDVGHFVEQLKQVGFRHIERGKIADIAVCDQIRGFPVDCEWLGTDVDGRGVRFCWLLGEEPGEMATQEGWTYEQSLYSNGSFRADDEPVDHLKFLRTENGLNVYLDEQTGKEVYAGRPFADKDDVHTVRAKALLFATSVKMVYDAMLADGWMSIQVNQDADASHHLIMRYRNQIGIVGIDTHWNEAALTEIDPSGRKLVDLAKAMKAIPLMASIDIVGQPSHTLNRIAEVEASSEIEFRLRRTYLVHDLHKGREWTDADYDLEAEVELSDWEIHDFGIQVVRQSLENDGHEIDAWNSNLDAVAQVKTVIDGKLTYIVVRTVRYPEKDATFGQEDLRLAAELAGSNNADLKIASVALASADDPFDPAAKTGHPIYRGTAVMPRFAGLSNPVITANG